MRSSLVRDRLIAKLAEKAEKIDASQDILMAARAASWLDDQPGLSAIVMLIEKQLNFDDRMNGRILDLNSIGRLSQAWHIVSVAGPNRVDPGSTNS